MQEEFDDWLLRNLPETEEVEDDEPLNKREKMWFMLKRRGWMTEVEIKRALEILRHTDEMFTDAGMDYFITDGLLLGHCRHAGFTPWDDDMDIATNRSNLEWLTSPQGLEAVAKHGLALETMWSGYHKLFLAGPDIPRAGKRPWGYPFLDVFPYDISISNSSSKAFISVQQGSHSQPLSLFLPPIRVDFHPGTPKGLLVPQQPGRLLDNLFPGWRTECEVGGFNHRLEDSDDSIKAPCSVMARVLGIELAAPHRCPSPSMKDVSQREQAFQQAFKSSLLG